MAPRFRRRPVATDRRFRKNRDISDYGPAERWQHSGRVLEPTERPGAFAARATEEHVVDILVMRGVLDGVQRAAALKFKLDYQRAGLAAHVTGSYSPIRAAPDNFRVERERSDFEEAAYRRWRNAVRELGLERSDLVISIICHDIFPAVQDLPPLQRGLDKLAVWYGLKKPG